MSSSVFPDRRQHFISALLLLLSACSGSSPPPGQCTSPAIIHNAETPPLHVPTCFDTCGSGLNPPTGGNHCGETIACRVFDSEQSKCKWIHNMEHGHAVLLYNCPDGCPDIVAKLQSIWERRGGTPKRMIVTPYPQLERKVAVTLWGWSWSGDEVDEAMIDCVLAHQDEAAPEPGLGCAQ